MAENAKDGAARKADAKKGRAKEETDEKVVKDEEVTAEETEETSANESEEAARSAEDESATEAKTKKTPRARKVKTAATAKKATASVKADDVMTDDVMTEDETAEELQAEIREQIENCKNELQISLERSIKEEFSRIVAKQLKAANRRRRAGAIVRDVLIFLLAATVGYFGWCLYDARYFDWMGPREEASANCPEKSEPDEPEEIVKDKRWYVNNYGYLFEDLQLGLDADSIEAYYLYSDDHKVSEMKPAYLLGMAYNKVVPATSSSTAEANSTIAASDLRTAFEGMFGTLDYFEKTNFTHGCKKFSYARESDSFVTENAACVQESAREIVEEIDEMYEEGSVLYVLTTAAIYDKEEASFYNFDNLFKPAVMNANKDDFGKNKAALNRYQYQFKKTGEKYHFSGIVKLQ